MYKEIEGDLIELAKIGKFDLIAHGCNCFCNMGAGIAVPMKNTFGCDKYKLEDPRYKGERSKLGKIDFNLGGNKTHSYPATVVNAYTQYKYGRGLQIDYSALRTCMRAIREITKPEDRIGLPKIGAGLAGGDWKIISEIIQEELSDRDVTIVIK